MKTAHEPITKTLYRAKMLFLASHSAHVIQNFCDKCVLLREGRLARFGPVDEVMEEYFGWRSNTKRGSALGRYSGSRK